MLDARKLSLLFCGCVLFACDSRRVCMELCDQADDGGAALSSDAGAFDAAAALPSTPEGEPAPSTLRMSLTPAPDCAAFDRALREQNVRIEQARIEHTYAAAVGPLCGSSVARDLPDLYPPNSVPRRDARAGSTSSPSDEEPDIVKTDGRILYVASRGLLRVLEATPPSSARELTRVRVEGAIRNLLLDGDRLVAYVSPEYRAQPKPCSYGPACEFTGTGELTRIFVFDVSTPSAPLRVRESRLSGSLLAARRIGSAVHTVVSQRVGPRAPLHVNAPALCPTAEERNAQLAQQKDAYREQAATQPLNDFLPFTYETIPAPFECGATLFSEAGAGAYVTTLHSFDLRDEQPAKALRVVSRAPVVHLTGRSAYLAVRARPAFYLQPAVEPESSVVHRFAIGPQASATRYEASGRVAGYPAGEFALDEWREHLRIVTTNGEQAKLPVGQPVVNQLHVLAQRGAELVVIGAIDRVTPPADLSFVRFAGPRAYLAVEAGARPLTIARLDAPEAPRTVGELSTSALPSQLLPLGEEQLLSIGYRVLDRVDGLVHPALTLETFQLSATGAQAIDALTIGDSGSLSSAYDERLVTLYDGARATLALPVAACTGGSADSAPVDDGLTLFEVTAVGARERGRVATNESPSSRLGCLLDPRGPKELAVKRAVLIGSSVYAVGDEVVQVRSLDALGDDLATVRLAVAGCTLDGAPLAHGESRTRAPGTDAGSGGCSCTCIDGTVECAAVDRPATPCAP